MDSSSRFQGNALASLDDRGTLTIPGTSSADTITFSQQGDSLTLTVNSDSELFSTSEVSFIDIDAGAGDDFVSLKRCFDWLLCFWRRR